MWFYIKKLLKTYVYYAQIVWKVLLKQIILVVHCSSINPYQWVYLCCVVLGTCDPRYASVYTVFFNYCSTMIFVFSCLVTIIYNNPVFAPILEKIIGIDFSKKYLVKNSSGIYIDAFLRITILLFLPYIFDLITLQIDHFEQLAQLDYLEKVRSFLFAEGRVEESRDVAQHLFALTHTITKGLLTKLNIILFSRI